MPRPERLDVIEQVVSCTRCSLRGNCKAPVAFSGPNPCSVAIIGEAPGAQEDFVGRPFIGPAGDLLRGALFEADLDATECFILNSVSCFPHGSPTSESIAACAPNRVAQLELADPTWVLLLGKVALGCFKSGMRIGVARGRPFRPGGESGPVFYATYHPAAGLRKMAYETDMRKDIKRFSKMVGDGIESWQKYLVDTCWECSSELVCWYDPDGAAWCEKHAPDEHRQHLAFLQAM